MPDDSDLVRDESVTKDPTAEPIYDEMFNRLERGESYSGIADWLNSIGVSTGPYCRLEKWDCRMVGRVVRNPILKGLRVRNDRMSKRVNSSGRSRSVKAPPEERLERECRHLAFIAPERYDRVLAFINERNGIYRRGKNGADPRANVARKRTRVPGQMAYCGICGRMFVFGGHGQTDHLMCDGARHYQCWNGATIDAPLAARRLADAISNEVESLEGFDSAFLEMIQEEAQQARKVLSAETGRIQRDIQRLEAEAVNLLQYLKDGESELVRGELRRVEQELARLRFELAEAERTRPTSLTLPSVEELKLLYHQQFQDLAVDSYEFAGQLRRLVPRLVVFPHMLCDGGPVVLRAKFRLELASLISDAGTRTVLQKSLEKVLTVDLFEPPQREKYRKQVVALRAVAGNAERVVARQLGITQPAVQYAAALQRLMDELGITDPYLPVVEPPSEGKLRRHKHKRYHFEPLDGAGEI